MGVELLPPLPDLEQDIRRFGSNSGISANVIVFIRLFIYDVFKVDLWVNHKYIKFRNLGANSGPMDEKKLLMRYGQRIRELRLKKA